MRLVSLYRAGILALGLFAGAAPLHAQQPPALIPATMAVPTFSLSFSLGYIAQDLGLYAKHGVAMTTREIQGLGAINSVISGSSDFAQPSAASLTRAAAHGQRLVAIVEMLDRPVAQVVLRKEVAEAGKFDPKAPLAQRALILRGKTIAIDSINSVLHAYVRLLANRAGYNPEDIRVAPMQPASIIAAFNTKQIDGMAFSPPWPQKLVLEDNAVMIASGPDGDPSDLQPFSNTVVVTKPETCEKRKALCEGVGQAFVDAAALVQNHPDQARAVLKKRFNTLDDKLLDAAFAVIRKITPNPPTPSQAGLENTELYNIQAGLMKPDEKLKSYDGLWTDAYVK